MNYKNYFKESFKRILRESVWDTTPAGGPTQFYIEDASQPGLFHYYTWNPETGSYEEGIQTSNPNPGLPSYEWSNTNPPNLIPVNGGAFPGLYSGNWWKKPVNQGSLWPPGHGIKPGPYINSLNVVDLYLGDPNRPYRPNGVSNTSPSQPNYIQDPSDNFTFEYVNSEPPPVPFPPGFLETLQGQ